MKEAKYDTKDLHMFLNKLYENCVTCLKFKRSSVTPKVSPPMARDFNQTVALDLKVWPKFNVKFFTMLIVIQDILKPTL